MPHDAQRHYSIAEKTSHITAILGAMLRDGRPELFARPKLNIPENDTLTPDEQITFQLEERMYSDQAITSRPGSYYLNRLDEDLDFPVNPGKSKPHDVRNRYHPISYRFAERVDLLQLKRWPRAYVCGADTQRRFEMAHIDKAAPANLQKNTALFPEADAYIIPAYGDVLCAYEMMAMINARMHGHDTHPERPIIIDNDSDYWKYLLWHMHDSDLQQLNIHTFREGHWHKAEALLEKSCKAPSPPASITQTIPPESLLLVGTKTNEKILELQELFKGTGVRVMRLDHFANFQDPKEISGTFAGNAMEKIRNAHKALRERAEQTPDALRQNLLNHCPNPNNPHMFILSEDSGIHMEDWRISRIMQQEGLLKGKVKDDLVLHHDQNPGVEFGPVLNGALGEEGFWNMVNDIIERHQDDDNPKTCTHNRGVVNSSVLALSPFNIDQPAQIQPVYMFSGTNVSMLLDKPIKEAGEIPNTSHFLVPITQGLIRQDAAQMNGFGMCYGGLTQAQLGPDFLGHHSARTFAARALRAHMGLPEGMDKPLKPFKLKIGVLNPQTASDFSQKHISKQITLETIDFSAANWPNQAEALCANPDVYYLSPRDGNDGNDGNDKALFNDLFRFCSLIVSKQLVPRDKDKPLIVRADDKSWKPFLSLYNHLRHVGMANDQQNTFIKRFDSEDALSTILEQTAMTKFNGEYYTPSRHAAKGQNRLKQKPKNSCAIAMFCSATSKNQTFNDEAKNLGEYLASQNASMVFGAADKEMMGSARTGYLAARKEGSKALLIGSSTEDILPIESEHPEAVIDSLDVYHHADHIYDRMQFMMRHSDAFVIYPGGVGTIQELMLLLCAKQGRNPDIKDKPIMLYNLPMKNLGLDMGFYDPLIELIGREKLQRYGVQICESQQQIFNAIDAAGEWRSKNGVSNMLRLF